MSSSLLAILFLGFSVNLSSAQEVAVPAAEPVMVNVSTIGETAALVVAINKHRTDLELPPLAVNAALSAQAALAFPAALNAAGEVDVTALRKNFDATNVGILRGIVTHRKEASGGEIPKYWAKDPQWSAVMSGDYSEMGAATVKRSDGKLVAFVYLIKR